MSENKTHWKKMTDTNFLGSWDVENEKLVATIVDVTEEMLKASPTQPEEKCIVAQLKGLKPMILNKTNCRAIEKRTGSAFVEDWKGQEITIYVAKVKAFGEMHDALRIEDFAPKKKTKATFKEGGYEKALDAVFNGTATADKIINAYQVNEEQAQQLKEAEITFKNKK